MAEHMTYSIQQKLASRWRIVCFSFFIALHGADLQAALSVNSLQMPQVSAASHTKLIRLRTAAQAAVVVLPKSANTRSALQQDNGVRQIGIARTVEPLATHLQTSGLLQWTDLATGGQAAALKIQLNGAWGARLEVRWQALPASAVIRMYAGDQAAAVHEVTGAALLERLPRDAATGERIWWTPDIGPQPVLEVLLPPGAERSSIAFSVPRLSEVLEAPAVQPLPAPAGANVLKWRSNECQQDVNCQSSLLELRNAVIRMVYVSEAKTFQCTGTLINNPRQDRKPYVLTSAHCAKDQETAATLQTSWFFYSQSCDGNQVNPGNVERYNGARWLASSLENDMTLLELVDTPPEDAVFAGWDAETLVAGQALAGIHHPRGDMQKFSQGVLKENAACTVDYAYHQLDCAQGAQEQGHFYRMTLTSGSIEPGSSGSALFVNGRVVGTLTGGDSWCPVSGAQVVYGRLDQALRSQFSPWLGEGTSAAIAIQPVYQFHIPHSGAEFYTISAQERDAVIAVLAGYVNYVGIAFGGAAEQVPGSVAVHRFFNPEVVAHFYTASSEESAYVQATYPQLRYEGIAWWTPAQAQPGMQALYRFYQFSASSHRYTLDQAQRDAWRGDADYLYDGLAYYVWAAPLPSP
ncbi:trypsin-like peptidase domain-containing protein [Comamonas sp. J-3]|uniref:trypsin-like peptidase domain-containing protein n=1 Tax=Comamonas trifloxystrobinivorans TaxID=3350256 RepID=UPI0037268FAF